MSTALSKITWVNDVPQLGGRDDEENLLKLLDTLPCYQDEAILRTIKTRLVRQLTTCPMEKVEKAAQFLIGRKYTFKEGVVGFCKDDQIGTMIARSPQLKEGIARGNMSFPYLSIESFKALTLYFRVERTDYKPTFYDKVEVYKSFGECLRESCDLLDHLLRFEEIGLEGTKLCLELLKNDPKVMGRLKFKLQFEPQLVILLYKHLSNFGWKLTLDGQSKKYDELIDQSENITSLHVKNVGDEQLHRIKGKKDVEIVYGYFTFLNGSSFGANNPQLESLSLISCTNISSLLAPTVTSLDLSHCTVNEDVWKKIFNMNLVHLGLNHISDLPKGKVQFIASRLESLTLDGDHYDLLQVRCPKLKKLTLARFFANFYKIEQPSVVSLRWHTPYSGNDYLLKGILPFFPNLQTLDLSLGDEVINNVSSDTFTVLKECSVTSLILQKRVWPHLPIKCEVVTSVEEIDVTLGDFFDGKFIERMKSVLAFCPKLKRVIYSGYETYNFPDCIESMRVTFKEIEFIER